MPPGNTNFGVGLIRWYQRYISPHKGFSCAHRALQGGLSCSAYALTQFETKTLGEAYRASRSRMRECGALYREYMSKQPVAVQCAVRQRKYMRYMQLLDPRLYVRIARGWIIDHWPKHNQEGGLR